MPFITYIFYYFSTYGIGTSNMTQQKFVLVWNSKYKNCMYLLSSVLCMNQRKLFYTPILERRRGAIKNKQKIHITRNLTSNGVVLLPTSSMLKFIFNLNRKEIISQVNPPLQFQSVEYVSFHTDSNRASKKNHKILIFQIDVGRKYYNFDKKY